MVEVIILCIVAVLILIDIFVICRDNGQKDYRIDQLKAINRQLKEENQQLRGDLLMKQADEFARDCGKELGL